MFKIVLFPFQRSRRIAKEVAIDYIRRYLDGEEERMDVSFILFFLHR